MGMIAERHELPDAPGETSRILNAQAFAECAIYDHGHAARSIRKQIRSGLIVFHAPDRLQLTKEGFDFFESYEQERKSA